MTWQVFEDEVAVLADLLSVSSLLAWDMRTTMPSGAVESRGQQMATISQIARERLLSTGMRRALDAAQPVSEDQHRAMAAVREAISYHERLPAGLVRERNLLKASAQAVWAEARSKRDFSIFAPLLDRTIVLARELAEAIGYAEHPHDALLGQFEPGATGSSLAPIFDALRQSIGPLLQRVLEQPAPAPLPAGPYPLAAQQAFGRMVAERFGYDFSRGRLDPTVHPFELAMTRNDVRITARYNPNVLDVGLKATMHETGHGLYEQGIDPALTRTALNLDLLALSSMGGASLSVHESQSRLWENHVGRSRPFWMRTLPQLREAFPEALSGTEFDPFYRAFNAVRPGKIRTEADELSYDFHIMLRTDLERSLIDGTLTVRDLPAAWNEAMQRDLGIEIDNDAEGVLQDIHWSMGQFGSFCSYTIGNVLAAQVFETAEAMLGVRNGIESGDFSPLRLVLTEKIYRHGRRYHPSELIPLAAGRPLDSAPYIAYLTGKYRQLYELV